MGACAPVMYRTVGLHKSFTMYGCLGTHDVWTDFVTIYGEGLDNKLVIHTNNKDNVAHQTLSKRATLKYNNVLY